MSAPCSSRACFAEPLNAALALMLASCTPQAHAHDFWLQPRAFRIDANATTPFTLQVGHGPFRQRSPIPMRRIERLDVAGVDGSLRDIRPRLRLGGDRDDGDVVFESDGVYVLVLQTDDKAESHLPAIRFNDYLRAEGLTPALALREHERRMDADGAENYRRVAKAIVQVGTAGLASGMHVTTPIGLPLEIVPERNPYAEPHAATLPVRVVYERRALAGALVKLTDLGHDAEPFETHVTDAGGRAEFTLPAAGAWLLNVIWTKPKPAGGDTEFETVFSSLSFGFPERKPAGEPR
jgi:uncharacterized GH25 family protein